jgi:four helix bundle protein
MWTHRDLEVWQQAKSFVRDIYVVTMHFPSTEQYDLISQWRRASVPVPANVAEGAARTGSAELAHHVSIAIGSLAEIETQLEMAKDLGFISASHDQPIGTHLQSVGRLLVGLRRSLRKK